MGNLFRSLFSRVLPSLVVVGLLIPAACSDSESPKAAKLAAGCTLNTDCNSPLVCAFQRCHNACLTSRDCPASQRCMASDRPFHVCQLEEEQTCAYNSQCPEGQVCGLDGQCRDQCASDRDCVNGQLCKKGNCADVSELDDAGNLPISDAGTEDAGSPGQPCVYNSECAEPLICRNRLCAFECLAKADCPTGLDCVDNRCSDSDTSPSCVRNSDCEEPLVCRSSRCVDECRKTVDCPAGQTCLERSCVLEPPGNAPADWGIACNYSVDCGTPLVCRSNHCVYQCMSDADCQYGATCDEYLCKGGYIVGGGAAVRSAMAARRAALAVLSATTRATAATARAARALPARAEHPRPNASPTRNAASAPATPRRPAARTDCGARPRVARTRAKPASRTAAVCLAPPAPRTATESPATAVK